MKTNKKTRNFRLETLEARTMLAADVLATDGLPAPPDPFPAEFASIDGTGNNQLNADWGSTGEQLLRIATTEYADGISDPAGEDRPSAREVSNAISAQTESIENDRQLTDILWLWGQFIDHDITLTEGGELAEDFSIEVPSGDIYFDPAGTGEQEISVTRSEFDEHTGDSIDNPRQQVNDITAFIDGSMIYGSDQERADALRTFEGGELKTSDGDLLPFNEEGLANAGGTSETLFLAGDVRANENAALSAMHTLWVREHNRVAGEIAAADPSLNDEEIYLRARAIVTGEIQAITYNEFLPALLGEDALEDYSGYDATVNPGIANLFSTAAYRLGHSFLSPELARQEADGSTSEEGNLALRDAFFNPQALTGYGIDSLLQGLSATTAQELDTQIVDDVRNFLFGPPGSGGFDLASLNIQRGRDHGLPDYNQAREDAGLARVESFSDITSDESLAAALEETYGDVDNIDVWVGMLAEDHVEGASTGEMMGIVIADQFTRLRDGDRFYYENQFEGRLLQQIDSTTLADVIQRNSEVENLQANVFFTADAPINQEDEGGGKHHHGQQAGDRLDFLPQHQQHHQQAGGRESGRQQREVPQRTSSGNQQVRHAIVQHAAAQRDATHLNASQHAASQQQATTRRAPSPSELDSFFGSGESDSLFNGGLDHLRRR